MNTGAVLTYGIFLILLNGYFVATEYALVSVRRSRIEMLAKGGNRTAKLLLGGLDELPRFIASCQIGVSICSLALGSVFEDSIGEWLGKVSGYQLPLGARIAVALLIGTFVTVVLGELIPKYVSLSFSERMALGTFRILRGFTAVFSPIVWLAQSTGALLLKPFKIDTKAVSENSFSREELLLLLREIRDDGAIESNYATVLGKALRFDKLDASDIMIHRLDIQHLDLDTPKEELMDAVTKIPHSRIPVCGEDLDDIKGILYTRDVLKALKDEEYSLERHLRPVVIVPANLTLNKIVERMRESRTQILLVVDEYGGTEGLITLEDVIEEVFGELDDAIESERPPIERTGSHRISARADIRYDELIEFMKVDAGEDASTDTLATILVERLERMPKLGDSVEFEFGRISVENMARRRITRVRVTLNRDIHL